MDPALNREDVRRDVEIALAEDLGPGDVTARLIPASRRSEADILTREDTVLCGQPWADEVFRQLDQHVEIHWLHRDGERLPPGTVFCQLVGGSRSLLSGERTALNFLQLLSGTAHATRQLVDAVAGSGARILDTRKTVPGLRTAQKYAVRCGGGMNHRMGLFDAVLVKENHIAAAGGLQAAVGWAREEQPHLLIVVEVETLEQLGEALTTQVDRILLDNFSVDALRAAVSARDQSGRKIALEASGSIDADSVGTIAATGVDFVSVGSLTKNVRAADLSMQFLGS